MKRYDFLKIVFLSLSVLFFIFAIIGFLLPVLPGFVFLFIALFLLLLSVPSLKKNQYVKKYTKKLSLDHENFVMRVFTILILGALMVFFTISVIIGNKEFVYYNLIIFPLVVFSYLIHKQLKLHLPVFIMLCTVFLMHAAGGVIYFSGTRLYDIYFWIFKYDFIVHAYGSFIVAFIVYSLISEYIAEYKKGNSKYLFLILVLMTAGVGTLIEMVELIAVVLLGASAGVGGYMNNAIDLVSNLVGAVVGSLIITRYHHVKKFKEGFINGKLGNLRA